jgi:hypothetical protein
MEGEGDPSASVSSPSGDMMQERSKFESNIETEIESSKVHWSELRSRCEDDGTQVVKDVVIDVATNREIFKSLQGTPSLVVTSFVNVASDVQWLARLSREPRLNSLK